MVTSSAVIVLLWTGMDLWHRYWQLYIQVDLLTAVPDNDDASTEWFDVKNIDLSNTSSISHTNFNINCNWVRIISKPESGSIDKVLLRN